MSLADPIPVARRETVVEAVADALIRYIAENGLRPGDRLPSERQLVEMTGASRLPLREALSMLKGLGIVESWHGKGVFVKQLDVAALFGMLSPLLRTHAEINVRQLFEARLALEVTIAGQAAEHRTQEHLEKLAEHLQQMQTSLDNRPEYMRHDTAFHRELANAAANPVFVIFMASITDLLVELQSLYREQIHIRRLAAGEHEAILEAVRDRDAAAARRAVEVHLANAIQRL